MGNDCNLCRFKGEMSIFGECGNFTTDLFRNHLNIARGKIQWVSKSTYWYWYSRTFSTSICFISTNVTNKKKLLIDMLRNITKSFIFTAISNFLWGFLRLLSNVKTACLMTSIASNG